MKNLQSTQINNVRSISKGKPHVSKISKLGSMRDKFSGKIIESPNCWD